MCKNYKKNNTQNTKLQKLTNNAGDKHQMYKKGPKRIKLNLQKANEPQMYKRWSGERKNYTKKVFLELYNELAAIFKYPIMKQLRVTVSACGVKT